MIHMAAINFSFSCRICKATLKPSTDNLEMLDFIMQMIQFHKDHDICEKNKIILDKQEAELKAKYEKPEAKRSLKKRSRNF